MIAVHFKSGICRYYDVHTDFMFKLIQKGGACK